MSVKSFVSRARNTVVNAAKTVARAPANATGLASASPSIDHADDVETPRRRTIISISTEHAFSTGLLATLGVLTALVIGGAVSNSILIITYIGAALFLAIGLEPVTGKLVDLAFPRPLAIATVFLGFLAIIAGVGLLIIPTAISEGESLAAQAPNLIGQIQSSAWFDWLNQQFQGNFDGILVTITGFLRDPQQWLNIAGGVFSVGASIAGGIFAIFTVTILTLYFMASLDGIQRASSLLVPASRRPRYMRIVTRVRDNVGRYMVSQIVIALINSVCAYIAMSIIGVRFAVILAPIVFLLALIPLIGSILCTVLTSLVALLSGLPTAIAMAIYYVVYMQIEAYVLTPHIVRRAMPVPGIVVVIAALLGGTLLGVMGALIAIPIAASAIMMVQELWIPRQDRL